jgi:hypothetical protein
VKDSDFKQAVAELSEAYALGTEILTETMNRPYGDRAMKTCVKNLQNKGVQIDESKAYSLARFADKAKGYSRKELKLLIAQCRQSKPKFVPSVASILRLLAIDDRTERRKIQKLLIEGSWSKRQVNQEVISWRRRSGKLPVTGTGRRLKALAKDSQQVANELESSTASFCRRLKFLVSSAKTDKALVPPAVLKACVTAQGSLDALLEAIEAHREPAVTPKPKKSTDRKRHERPLTRKQLKQMERQ